MPARPAADQVDSPGTVDSAAGRLAQLLATAWTESFTGWPPLREAAARAVEMIDPPGMATKVP